MKAKIISLTLSSLYALSFTNGAQAEDFYSTQMPNGGYSSSYSGSTSPGYESSSKHHQGKRSNINISVNLPSIGANVIEAETIFAPNHHRRGKDIGWVNMMRGMPLPYDAVIGGSQPYPPATLYVCRAQYNGGLHPGKLFAGNCNIGWGGDEIVATQYQVLVSYSRLHWVSASHGYIPVNAIRGGYEQGNPLFICQAEYRRGMHTGKVVGQMCHIGWGGKEIAIPYYNVLVR